MKLLETADYALLQSLLGDAQHDLAVFAIAAGRAQGRVFVDDPRDPRLALVLPHWGRLYVLGRANFSAAAALRQLLDEELRPAAGRAGARGFTIGYPPDFEPYLTAVLEGTPAVQAERQYYRWTSAQVPAPSLPEGFTLAPADGDLLADDGLANLQILRDEMASERASVDDFLAHSFGIAALHNRQLAGFCLSEYNVDGRCEVGIATLEPFQRRGLATAMGRAFLAMAQTSGIQEVGWHCWKQNVPSAAAAHRIGLQHVADYRVFFGSYQ
jgi:GNAT superfamily N-acetyltransferase